MTAISGDQVPTSGPRLIELEGAYNVRDLGGVVTSAGHGLRTGLVFRSSSLDSLTTAGLTAVEALGIKTVLDLRSAEEIEQAGHFPHDRVPVRWEHLASPFGPPGVGDPSDRQRRILDHPDPMAVLYVDLMREMATEFGRAIRILSDPSNLPAIFHCTSGKDRSGLLAALIQLLVGVPLPIVITDYEASSSWSERIADDMLERYPMLRDQPTGKLHRMAGTNRNWLLAALAVAGGHRSLDEWFEANGCAVHHQIRLRSTLIDVRR